MRRLVAHFRAIDDHGLTPPTDSHTLDMAHDVGSTLDTI